MTPADNIPRPEAAIERAKEAVAWRAKHGLSPHAPCGVTASDVSALLSEREALVARVRELEGALRKIDHLSLVILASVNHADQGHVEVVGDAIRSARALLPTQRQTP